MVLGYDGSELVVLRHGMPVIRKPVSLPGFAFCDQIIRSGLTTLSKVMVSASALTLLPFIAIPDRFCCFATDFRVGITVIGSRDGNLRIRLNRTTLKLATVSLGGELPLKILITRKWGFIVVKTATKIRVFTSNGLFVSEAMNSADIKSWTCFRSFDGFDFVAYDSGDGKLRYFEAADPTQLRSIQVQGKIQAFTFAWRVDRFLIATSDGIVHLCPRSDA
jgi:hypothetical protein